MRYAAALDASGTDFTWRVARAGYSLVHASTEYLGVDALEAGLAPFTKRNGLAFKAQVPSRENLKDRGELEVWEREHFAHYRPADRADLHRAFATIQSQPEAALGFVNAHGPITRSLRHAFLEDFYAGQELIRGILRIAQRETVRDKKVEDAINGNKLHFLLGVTVTPTGKLVHRVLPDSLLGWMLLKALEQLTGTAWKQCAVCGKSFEVSDDRQAHQRFCSDPCRQKNHRNKRRH